MPVYILRLLALYSIILLPFSINAQKLESTLSVYAEKYAQERAYLHYDKSSYHPGETIWFKAYLMEGILPAEGSKTLYVDWVDDKGAVLSHTVSPLVEASAYGQFEIPANYAAGVVHVRAYTKWMLNFDSSFLYHKSIRIMGKAPAAAPAKINIIPTINFFPEGGDIVAGVKNKVAFKVADQWGQPVKVRGTIRDNKGAFVDSFSSVHNGMGSFLLIPQKGASYTAKWKDTKGTEYSTELPAVKNSGITLQVTIAKNKRIFAINRTEDVPDKLKRLHLIGTMHQHLVFKANINLNNPIAGGAIPTESLPTGVLTVTVFDDDWNAIAERITYINNQEYSFNTEMSVQRWGLSKRARDEIQITIPDSMVANLSVSVTDAGIDRDSSDNIFSHLLLTGDIRGSVYKPAYYFSGNTDFISQHLDLVMLTHGWRRFKWEDVALGKMPSIKYPKDTSYLSLSGKLFGVPETALRNAGSIFMFVKQKDSSSKMVIAPIAADGSFSNPDFIFFDTLRIYYQPSKGLKGADVSFMNNRLAALNYKGINLAGIYPDTAGTAHHYRLAQEQARLRELLRGKVLEEVTVRAKTKPPIEVMDQKYASGLFRGADAYQFDLVNDVTAGSSMSIFHYLQGRVAGLQITTGGTPSLQWRGGSPQLYLDEMRVEPDMVSSIPVTDVAYIKVFRPPFMGPSGGGNGAIAIYTRRGSDAQSTPGRGLATNSVMGYSPIKEFYSPNYTTFSQRNSERDVRTTLYWNPMIMATPQQRNITISFFNNDVSESFRVVVEGMTKDGRLTHLEQIME